MGRPKLTLPLGGRSVVRRLLDALALPAVTGCVVVLRKDDDALLAEVSPTVAVVRPDVDPPDMRRSVELGLEFVRETFSPRPDDGWLLSPADHPVLNAAVLEELIDRWRRSSAGILVPTHSGRRGHPTFFRWSFADAVFGIPPDCGLNALLQQFREQVEEVPTNDPCVLTDLDTPADYDRLRREFETDG